MRVSGQRHSRAAINPQGNDTLDRSLDGPQSRSGQRLEEKSFDSAWDRTSTELPLVKINVTPIRRIEEWRWPITHLILNLGTDEEINASPIPSQNYNTIKQNTEIFNKYSINFICQSILTALP
jgi:hypothetical protein